MNTRPLKLSVVALLIGLSLLLAGAASAQGQGTTYRQAWRNYYAYQGARGAYMAGRGSTAQVNSAYGAYSASSYSYRAGGGRGYLPPAR